MSLEALAPVSRRYPLRKIISAGMIVVGIAISFYHAPLLWLLLLYPGLALLVGATAVIALCTHLSSPRVLHAFRSLVRLFLGVATIIVAFYVPLIVSELDVQILHRLSDCVGLVSLFIPQFLWFPRVRASPFATLIVSLASVGLTVVLRQGGFTLS